MKIFVTPPMNHLELSELGDKNFYILGQLYKRNEKYREYTKNAIKQGRFTILDSGVGDEGEVLTNKELFKLTLEIQPNEVIPLDVLYNKEETLNNFNQFLNWMKDARRKGFLYKRTSILACPQGDTYEDWMECYRYFLNNNFVSCIGMSKKAIPHIMKNPDIAEARTLLVAKLEEQDLLRKPLHFLGQGNPIEFRCYNTNHHAIRSTDSCYPILSALHGVEIEKEGVFKRIPTPPDYFEKEVKEEDIELIKKNVDYLRRCCTSTLK